MARIDWGNHTINFFAVLFSVFLAFYLTEKAEEWKARSELDEILSALIEDLESDQRTYKEYQIPQNQNHVTDLGYVIEHLVTGKRDSVEAQLGAVLSVDNYSPVSSTYLSIKNSGKTGADRRLADPQRTQSVLRCVR
jgi:ribosomal protein L19